MKDKIKKEPKAEIIAFYTGGAKVHATTTHSKVELERMMIESMNDKPAVKIDTVNEDPEVADDSLTLLFDKLLFFTIFEKAPKPIIQSLGGK
jgi:hypothetical protein